MRFSISPASESERNATPASDKNEKKKDKKKKQKRREKEACGKKGKGGGGRAGKVQKKKSTTKRRRRRAADVGVECVDLRIRRASLRIPRWRVYATGHNGICRLPRSSSRSI